MCCCIPLRTLSHFGAIIHQFLGLYYLYLLGSVSYSLYFAIPAIPNKPMDDGLAARKFMGFMYMAYYAAFLPPGIFIFWGVHKKLRRFLVWPPFAFLLIQLYGIGLQSAYGFRPQSVPEVIKNPGNSDAIRKLKVGFWIDVFTQLSITIAYLFMLFFYYREIGPESPPIQSRYAQYPYIAQTVAAVAAHQHHQQQQAAALALHRPQPQQGSSSGSGQPPPTQPAPPPPNQTPQPTQIPPHLSHLTMGSNQAVSYHPSNMVGVGSPPPTSMPVAISPAASGPMGVMNPQMPPSLPSRTSSATTVPQASGPPINLGALAALSYEQQQQILKFHQQQLMLQQQQQHHHIPHSSAIDQELQQQILQQFPAYAALLAANQPGKAPKY